MSDCSCSANSQLKALHARVERIDNDLAAHYSGISQLVIGLAANPLTAASVVKLVPIYNLTSVGQRLLAKLMSMLPGIDVFRRLQHLDSAALVGGLADNAAAATANMAATVAEQTAQIAAERADAEIALAQAMANNAAGDVLGPIQERLEQLDRDADRMGQASSAIFRFMQTLTDISECRTRGSIIRG